MLLSDGAIGVAFGDVDVAGAYPRSGEVGQARGVLGLPVRDVDRR
ncbi:MAG: hypothetical protein AABO58_05725 [Acidobacteriota bacterium]